MTSNWPSADVGYWREMFKYLVSPLTGMGLLAGRTLGQSAGNPDVHGARPFATIRHDHSTQITCDHDLAKSILVCRLCANSPRCSRLPENSPKDLRRRNPHVSNTLDHSKHLTKTPPNTPSTVS